MKRLFCICLSITMMCGCTTTSTTKKKTIKSKPPEIIKKNKNPDEGLVRIQYGMLRDYPAGEEQVFLVKDRDEIIPEGAQLPFGAYTFTVLKEGYKKLTLKDVNVHDDDGDGKFTLRGKLLAKDRIVRFDIVDKATKEVIEPTKVSVADEQKTDDQQVINDRAYIKPGRKIIVIYKEGYESVHLDEDIRPSEEPFILHAEMTSKK